MIPHRYESSSILRIERSTNLLFLLLLLRQILINIDQIILVLQIYVLALPLAADMLIINRITWIQFIGNTDFTKWPIVSISKLIIPNWWRKIWLSIKWCLSKCFFCVLSLIENITLVHNTLSFSKLGEHFGCLFGILEHCQNVFFRLSGGGAVAGAVHWIGAQDVDCLLVWLIFGWDWRC